MNVATESNENYSKTTDQDSLNNEQFFDNNLGFIIGKVHRKLRKQWHTMLEPLNLSPPQSAVLSLVAANHSISQRETARELEIDVMAVRRVLQDLEKIGLIKVTQNQSDSRKFSYNPTEQGEIVANKISELSLEQKRQLEMSLGPIEFRQMSECLSKLLD